MISSSVGLEDCWAIENKGGPPLAGAVYPVPGLASIFEYGVVDVKESVPERGDCAASALAATGFNPSADFGSES